MGGLFCLVAVVLIASPLLATRRTQAVVLLLLCSALAVFAYEQQTSLIVTCAVIGLAMILLASLLSWFGVILAGLVALTCTLLASQSAAPESLGIAAFLAWITTLGMFVTLLDEG